MITYKDYKKLHESLGTTFLGIAPEGQVLGGLQRPDGYGFDEAGAKKAVLEKPEDDDFIEKDDDSDEDDDDDDDDVPGCKCKCHDKDKVPSKAKQVPPDDDAADNDSDKYQDGLKPVFSKKEMADMQKESVEYSAKQIEQWKKLSTDEK